MPENSRTYRLPYGSSSLEFRVPGDMTVTVAISRRVPALADPAAAIREALDHPIASPPLAELAKPGQRACIVFTDITRCSPDALLVPAMLADLERAGIRDEDITLLCALGMHRASTPQEKIEKLGADTVARYRVIDHEPQNPSVLADLGTTPGGVPVSIHRAAYEADLLIATGIVEPHQYAGYSGGRKTVAVGVAGEALIAHTHGPAFVDHPATRLGRIEGNPFHEAVSEAARRAKLRFILNVVLDEEQRLLKVAAGEPEAAFNELVAFARSVYEVEIPHQFDIAVAGVGCPKDSNLYQASRAASYLFFAPVPAVRDGGVIIIPAPCEEGAGEGVGEQRFLAAMRDAPDVQAILDSARRDGYPPGQQRAFVMAKVLEKNTVIIAGSQHPDVVRLCKMVPASDMDEALRLAVERVGAGARLLIVPHALQTLPVIRV